MDDDSKNVLTLSMIKGDCNKSLFRQYCRQGRVQLLYNGKYPNKGNKFNFGRTSNKCECLKSAQAPLQTQCICCIDKFTNFANVNAKC